MMEQTKSIDKKKVYYENLWHDIWHEEEIYEILDTIKDWIKNRIPKNEIEGNQ